MLREKLIEYIIQNSGMSENEVNCNTPLFSSGILDSFTLTEVITLIEDESGIKMGITDIKLENLDSINRIINFVEKQEKGE